MRSIRRISASESGASIVILAFVLVLLLGVAALAVDLAAVRVDIRSDRLATDAAATAGAASINPFAGNQADVACNVAWDYLLLNLDDEGTTLSPPDCTMFASSCDPAVSREATASAGPYSFIITHPVPDGDPALGGQAIDNVIDGVACQRLGVSVARTREYTFARVLGFNSSAPEVTSVARIGAGVGSGEVVPLLVLEPIACDALFTSGQGKLTVSYLPPDSPGFIVVDSDGSKSSNPNRCGSNSWTIDSKGTQNGWIRAIPTPSGIPSAILSYALSGESGAVPAHSYDPNDLTSPVDPADITDPSEPAESHFRLYPKPVGVTRRITRAPIDWRYNCKAIYPGYPIDLGDVSAGSIPIDPCPDPSAPFIDQLVSNYGGSGNPGFVHRWTDFYPCDVNNGSWANPSIDVTGNWWVDCTALVVNNDKNVTFSGGNVVFDGDIDLRSSASLIVNQSPSTNDRIVYVRDGDLLKGAQSSIELRQTFVYLENGLLDMVGGAGGLIWTAPISGQFEDLALWSEAPDPHQIGGQAGNTLTGTFFTPLADPFSITGQGGQFQTDAQFLTRRLEIKGQGEIRMHPDPDRQTLIPIREVRLIR